MPETPPKQQAAGNVRRAFNRAARTFDEYAVLHREIGERLFERLAYMQIEPALVMDLGAGTGHSARLLEKRYGSARILLVDIASAMLEKARNQKRRWFSRALFCCADAARLSLPDGMVDLVFSNLVLPWCEDLAAVFSECQRVLRPGGLFIFSTFGPGTLSELREAWARVDQHPHVGFFLDMHDVGDVLIRSGFSAPVLDRDNITLTYTELQGLLRDLRGTGARNSHISRAQGLTGRSTFNALAKAYEPRREAGCLPATFEVVFGHAWKPLPNARAQDGSTVSTFPLHQLTRRAP